MRLRGFVREISLQLGRAERLLAVLILAAMTAIVTLQVIFRYLLGQPLAWSEELARLLQVWLTYIAVGTVLGERGHIEVDFFVGLLPVRVRVLIAVFTDVLIALFSVVLINAGVALVTVQMASSSSALRIPMAFFSLPITIASVLVLLHLPDLVARRWEEYAAESSVRTGGRT